jgi:hypothetical protein
MIERVPCRSAHCKARSPRKAIPAARDENFLAGHRSQLGKELFPNRCFLLSHPRITQTSGDEMVQRRRLIFARSTPSDPLERLSKDAAFGSHLKSNCDVVHIDSLMVLFLTTAPTS